MRIGLLQHDIVWEDRDATLAHLTPSVARAAAAGVELLVLTEMFATGFSMRPDRTTEPESGPIVAWMTQCARDHGMRLVGSLACDPGDGGLPTNRLVIVGSDGVEHRYDKLHPFTRSGEHEHFRAGDTPVVADVDGIRFGLTVCYDLRFANLYWDLGPRVDAFLVIANWPA
ncbi:MAG: nitrilase-related carbon-nitrogen hydrolase, partial [Nitriliruptoraceae bacterium]